MDFKATLYSMLSFQRVDDVSASEAKPPVRIVEDNVAATPASATYAMTLVTAWMP
jgi:hypothetical protein